MVESYDERMKKILSPLRSTIESGKMFSQVMLSATAHIVPVSLPKYRSLIDEDREITDGVSSRTEACLWTQAMVALSNIWAAIWFLQWSPFGFAI